MADTRPLIIPEDDPGGSHDANVASVVTPDSAMTTCPFRRTGFELASLRQFRDAMRSR